MAHSQRGRKMLNTFMAIGFCMVALGASVLIVFLMDIILLRSIKK